MTVQVSDAYNRTGRTSDVYSRSFVESERPVWDQMRSKLFMTPEAIPVRRNCSERDPSVELIALPRYTNCSTLSTDCPPSSQIRNLWTRSNVFNFGFRPGDMQDKLRTCGLNLQELSMAAGSSSIVAMSSA